MNFKLLAENMGLDEKEYLEIVGLFIKATSSDLSKLQTAVEEGNVQNVIERAHSIKGAALNLMFTDIHDISNKIERNAHENRLDGAIEAIKTIKSKMDLIADILKKEEN